MALGAAMVVLSAALLPGMLMVMRGTNWRVLALSLGGLAVLAVAFGLTTGWAVVAVWVVIVAVLSAAGLLQLLTTSARAYFAPEVSS